MARSGTPASAAVPVDRPATASATAASATATATAPAATTAVRASAGACGAEDQQRGCLLVLEGIDGCGKTTQLQALAAWLPGSGLLPPGAQLLCTREPGGTALGGALRQLLLHAEAAQAPCPQAELLLYAADRAQHVEQVIRPALRQGHWVLSDRFSGSTLAYQGHGRGLDLALIEQLEAIACAGLQPDLTLWLDLPLEISLARRRRQVPDRIEAAGEAFLERVRAGFASLAVRRGWRRIEAAADREQVAAACREAVLALVGNRQRAGDCAAGGQGGQVVPAEHPVAPPETERSDGLAAAVATQPGRAVGSGDSEARPALDCAASPRAEPSRPGDGAG